MSLRVNKLATYFFPTSPAPYCLPLSQKGVFHAIANVFLLFGKTISKIFLRIHFKNECTNDASLQSKYNKRSKGDRLDRCDLNYSSGVSKIWKKYSLDSRTKPAAAVYHVSCFQRRIFQTICKHYPADPIELSILMFA